MEPNQTEITTVQEQSVQTQQPAVEQQPIQQSQPANVQDNNSADESFVAELRNAMKEHFDYKQTPDNNLPANLLDQAAQAGLSDNQNEQTEQPSIQQTEQQEENNESAEAQENQQDQEEREEITSVYIEKFGREFSLNDIATAIEGFNYYHPKVMQLQSEIDKLAKEKADFEALKQSSEGKLLTLFKQDPNLRNEFVRILKSRKPEAYNQHAQNSELESMRNELNELKQQYNSKLAEEQNFIRQQQSNQVIRDFDSIMTAKLSELKNAGFEVDKNTLESIGRDAAALIKTQQLPFEPNSIAQYYSSRLDQIRQFVQANNQKNINNYRQQKRNAPPPPPSGGAAPVIQANVPKNFDELEDYMAQKFAQVLTK